MELVFVKSQNLKEQPYTTSRIISECGGQEHESVMRLIKTHEAALKEFGKVGFEIGASESGQKTKTCKLNEEQATFLVTLMKNSIPVVEFKKNLVKQFYQMRTELSKRQVEREVEKQARKDLTAEIQECLGNDQTEFIKYTQLIYQVLFNKTAQQLRDEYFVMTKITPKDFMSAYDISKIKQAEYMTLTLLEIGMDYHEIKSKLINKFNK